MNIEALANQPIKRVDLLGFVKIVAVRIIPIGNRPQALCFGISGRRRHDEHILMLFREAASVVSAEVNEI